MSVTMNVHNPTESSAHRLSTSTITLDIEEENGMEITLFLNQNNGDGLAFARKLVVAATNAVALIQSPDEDEDDE